LANLDCLRAVAVGLVFSGHLLATMRIRGSGDIGHFGVLLFFVHTSLVLMMSMERLGLSRRKLYATFMIRRIFRIYPLNILCVIAVVTFRIPSTSWLGGYRWDGWSTLISNVFLTQNLTQSRSVDCVLWSLPFEMQMYAILPLLFGWALRLRSLAGLTCIWLAAAMIAGSEYNIRSGSSTTDFLLVRYFPCFVAGAIAWWLLRTRERHFPGWAWPIFLILLVLLYRLVDALRVYGPGTLMAARGSLRNDQLIWWPPYFDLVRDWLFCAVTGLTIPLCFEIRSRWITSASNGIARYSYGIYVSHVPILWLCFVWLPIGPPLVNAVIAVLLTTAVSMLLYHSLEDPAIRIGKRLAMRLVRGHVHSLEFS